MMVPVIIKGLAFGLHVINRGPARLPKEHIEGGHPAGAAGPEVKERIIVRRAPSENRRKSVRLAPSAFTQKLTVNAGCWLMGSCSPALSMRLSIVWRALSSLKVLPTLPGTRSAAVRLASCMSYPLTRSGVLAPTLCPAANKRPGRL